MSEKLIIRNFGPIIDVELDLRKMNVIIGEQATGKSTIAKLLAVCRYFSYIIENTQMTNGTFEQGLIEWGLGGYFNKNSYIGYSCKDYLFSAEPFPLNLSFSTNGNEISSQDIIGIVTSLIPMSNEFKQLVTELKKLQPNAFEPEILLDKGLIIAPSFYQNNVSMVMNNPFYFPTERGLQSIFSLGKSSIANISDSLFNQFAKIDMINKSFKSEVEISPLGITYKNENGKGFIKKNNENKYHSLANGASGYQSVIPIVLVNKYYTDLRKKTKTLLIEEPELNLYPAAQKELINYLVSDSINANNQVLLTTHSPYILTSLNNLMYAYEVGKENSDEVEKVIEKKYWLNPDDVSVYELRTDGTCEDIFDREESLIKVEKIDEISTVLNRDFNKLINIEIGLVNEKH
jgi:predicted ATPase